MRNLADILASHGPRLFKAALGHREFPELASGTGEVLLSLARTVSRIEPAIEWWWCDDVPQFNGLREEYCGEQRVGSYDELARFLRPSLQYDEVMLLGLPPGAELVQPPLWSLDTPARISPALITFEPYDNSCIVVQSHSAPMLEAIIGGRSVEVSVRVPAAFSRAFEIPLEGPWPGGVRNFIYRGLTVAPPAELADAGVGLLVGATIVSGTDSKSVIEGAHATLLCASGWRFGTRSGAGSREAWDHELDDAARLIGERGGPGRDRYCVLYIYALESRVQMRFGRLRGLA